MRVLVLLMAGARSLPRAPQEAELRLLQAQRLVVRKVPRKRLVVVLSRLLPLQ